MDRPQRYSLWVDKFRTGSDSDRVAKLFRPTLLQAPGSVFVDLLNVHKYISNQVPMIK
jgi:hypothetical protein